MGCDVGKVLQIYRFILTLTKKSNKLITITCFNVGHCIKATVLLLRCCLDFVMVLIFEYIWAIGALVFFS